MPKTTEEKAAELRTEARKAREENYLVKRRADFRCGEPGCHSRDRMLVVELPTEGEADFKLGVRCTLHVGEHPIRPFQFNESEPPDQAA
jgi:hypothetical protein